MPARSECPWCSSSRVELLTDYHGDRVDYFRCLDCHHLWNVPKGQNGPVVHVTPFPTTTPMTLAAHAEALFTPAERAMSARRQMSADYGALQCRSIELAHQASELVRACRELLCPDQMSPSTHRRPHRTLVNPAAA